jgi:methionyl-tRNA synthetase
MLEKTRVLAILIWPILPTTAEKIFEQLALKESPDRFEQAKWGGLKEGHQIGKPSPLFPRKDLKK